jgi:8-oxo-dGTP pyrophosphatase MutT (NUDIX family)
MAFPGGRQHAGDATLLQTAMRETHEEVGLDLSREAEHIGQLDDLQAIARGKPQETVIRPFVFEVHRESPIEVDETEVAEALWTPLLPLYRGEVDTVRTTSAAVSFGASPTRCCALSSGFWGSHGPPWCYVLR